MNLNGFPWLKGTWKSCSHKNELYLVMAMPCVHKDFWCWRNPSSLQVIYFLCFILFLPRQKYLFNFPCKSSIFVAFIANRENKLFPYFEKPITSYQGGSQSSTAVKITSWKYVHPFENNLWNIFPLIIIVYEVKQHLFAHSHVK